MHATLIYTTLRGFVNSETLEQARNAIFENSEDPISVETVSAKYSSIIQSS